MNELVLPQPTRLLEAPVLSPVKLAAGLLIGGVLLGVDWLVGLVSLATALVVLVSLSKSACRPPWWRVMLGTAPAAVLCQLIRTLQAPLSPSFAPVREAINAGMWQGFCGGVAVVLLVGAIRTWSAWSIPGVVGLLMGGLFFLTPSMCGCSTKERAYVAAMKSDLRNLEQAQREYFERNSRYATAISQLDHSASPLVFSQIVIATGNGWYATAAYHGVTTTCNMYVGSGVAHTTTGPGKPDCR